MHINLNDMIFTGTAPIKDDQQATVNHCGARHRTGLPNPRPVAEKGAAMQHTYFIPASSGVGIGMERKFFTMIPTVSKFYLQNNSNQNCSTSLDADTKLGGKGEVPPRD